MIRRHAAWLPWALVILAIVVAGMEIIVSLQNQVATSHRVGALDWLVAVEVSLPPIAFAAVGAFVVTRRPGNRIGWLMIVIGLGFALGSFTSDYPGFAALTHRPTRPLGTFVAWVSTWISAPFLSALFLLLLLFPTGELPSRRWKPVLWIGVAAWVVASVLGAVARGPIDNEPLDNPYGLLSIPQVFYGALQLCGLLAMVGAVLSLALRFRTAHGNVGQQLKWFTSGAALTIALFVLAFATNWSNFTALLAVLALAGMPIVIGIAILRYRLFDIDVLINRTLVYGTLTAALALLYLGQILVLQTLFRLVTGQQSDIAIAFSTIAIAALFGPLRRRIQSGIDRRFYRRKYDAARTIAGFQSRMRDEVDLGRLTADLVQVVHETVQPTMVSVWLREEGYDVLAARGKMAAGQE